MSIENHYELAASASKVAEMIEKVGSELFNLTLDTRTTVLDLELTSR